MLQRLHRIHQLKTLSHPQHAIIGLAQIVVGLILILNDYYFFWPPFMVAFLNDDLIGGCGIIFGIMLIKWAFSNRNSVQSNRNLLLFSMFFWAFEATAEALHGYIAGQPHMFTASGLEIIMLLMVLHLIGKSPKHDKA